MHLDYALHLIKNLNPMKYLFKVSYRLFPLAGWVMAAAWGGPRRDWAVVLRGQDAPGGDGQTSPLARRRFASRVRGRMSVALVGRATRARGLLRLASVAGAKAHGRLARGSVTRCGRTTAGAMGLEEACRERRRRE